MDDWRREPVVFDLELAVLGLQVAQFSLYLEELALDHVLAALLVRHVLHVPQALQEVCDVLLPKREELQLLPLVDVLARTQLSLESTYLVVLRLLIMLNLKPLGPDSSQLALSSLLFELGLLDISLGLGGLLELLGSCSLLLLDFESLDLDVTLGNLGRELLDVGVHFDEPVSH